jgi:hypothetical protein
VLLIVLFAVQKPSLPYVVVPHCHNTVSLCDAFVTSQVVRALATVRDLAAREAEAEQPDAFGEDAERDGAKMAWQAWLGYYNGQLRKLNLTKEQLVGKSAEYAATLGLPQIPALQKKTIGKMGLQVRTTVHLLLLVEHSVPSL